MIMPIYTESKTGFEIETHDGARLVFEFKRRNAVEVFANPNRKITLTVSELCHLLTKAAMYGNENAES